MENTEPNLRELINEYFWLSRSHFHIIGDMITCTCTGVRNLARVHESKVVIDCGVDSFDASDPCFFEKIDSWLPLFHDAMLLHRTDNPKAKLLLNNFKKRVIGELYDT